MNQPEINIGLIGHVSHGKSSLVRALSGKTTMTHSMEKVRNSTVNLGYANLQIGEKSISFIDCPGHQAYMFNMLSAVPLMDMAFLLVDATDEKVLQSQAEEHLSVLLAFGVKNIYVLQNKVDLLDKSAVIENRKKILLQLQKYNFTTQIFPISAQFSLGLEPIYEMLQPKTKTTNEECLIMPIVRSFDINKPGTNITELKGGVIGGSIINGIVKLQDKILIIPGKYNEKENICYPFVTDIRDICSETLHLQKAHKGGLIALQLGLDPYFTKNNGLIGQTIYCGKKENINIYKKIRLQTISFRDGGKLEGNIKIHCMNNVVQAKILEKIENEIIVELEKPIVIMPDWILGIFLNVKQQWKFCYKAMIVDGEKIECNIKNFTFPNLQYITTNKEQSSQLEFNAKLYNKQLRILYEKMEEMQKEKMAMIYPKIAHNGNKTFWTNYKETVKHIVNKTNNTEENMEKLFGKLLKDVFDNNLEYLDNSLVIGKKVATNQLVDFLKKFKTIYLECNACKSCQTQYSKKVKKCFTCNFEKHFS